MLVALLAATMGSPATFPNAEEEKTGKRLEEQVVAVRVKRPRKAATKAVQERKAARAAAASDALLAATTRPPPPPSTAAMLQLLPSPSPPHRPLSSRR